jgi:N-acetylglucosamine kinase-like BadF-type ATPase
LFDLIRHLVSGVRLPPDRDPRFLVCIGLTGVSFAYDAEIDLTEAVVDMPWLHGDVGLICTGDAEITFASHARCLTGSAIICHAGSVAFAVIDGKPHRFGGWGPAFADQGSGYSMGRVLLQRISKYYDAKQFGPEDRSFQTLWERVDRWLSKPGACDSSSDTLAWSLEPLPEWELVAVEWKRIRSVIENVYGASEVPSGLFSLAHHVIQEHGASTWWSIVSSLAIPLFDAWREEVAAADNLGVSIATEVVDDAIRELVRQYTSLRERLSPVLSEAPLVMAGGICNHNVEFRNRFVDELGRVGVRYGPLISRHSPGAMRPALGALMLGLGGSSRIALHLPSSEVMAEVTRTAAAFPEAMAND